MIASATLQPKEAKVKRPKTAEEWTAYEGKPVFCKERNGRPNTAMLLEVMAPDKARITPADHGHPEVVLLKDLRPWVKGMAEQDAVRILHGQRADEAARMAEEDRRVEICVLFDPRRAGFLGGISVTRTPEKNGVERVSYEALPKKAGTGHPLKDATRLPRVAMAQLFAYARKNNLLDSSARYLTLPEAEKVWADVQVGLAAAKKAKAAAVEAERQARVAAEKAAAEKPIAAIPRPSEPQPTLAPVPTPETAPASLLAPSAALAKALAERQSAQRALAYAENLVLEAKGKLVMANAEVEIARNG